MSDALKDTFDTPRGCAFLYDGGTGTLCGRPERDSVHRAPSNDEDSNLYHAFVSLKATNATLVERLRERARYQRSVTTHATTPALLDEAADEIVSLTLAMHHAECPDCAEVESGFCANYRILQGELGE